MSSARDFAPLLATLATMLDAERARGRAEGLEDAADLLELLLPPDNEPLAKLLRTFRTMAANARAGA